MREDDLLHQVFRLLLQLIARIDQLLDTLRQPAVAPGRWLDTKAAARRIGCNRAVLRRWCQLHMMWCEVCQRHSNKPCEGHIKKTPPGVRYVTTDRGVRYEIHESVVEEWRSRHRGEGGAEGDVA